MTEADGAAQGRATSDSELHRLLRGRVRRLSPMSAQGALGKAGAARKEGHLLQRIETKLGFADPVEARVAFALGLLLVAFRLVNLFTWKFDTDESQHLHVVWGWARGFVQYRDLCDNHMPLFQMLCAPIYWLIGDRPDVLYGMRLMMLPLFLLTAWTTYRIGAVLFSPRVGAWAMLMAGFYPGYHCTSLEFRPDNLWAPVWLLTVLVLIDGPLTRRKALGAGVLLGVCFGISMKTSLLCLSLLAGGALTLLFVPGWGKLSLKASTVRGVTFLLGVVLIPGAIMAGFAWAGVWPQFRYWVFENNLLPGLLNHAPWWSYLFPVLFPATSVAIVLVTRRLRDRSVARRRAFVGFTGAFYMLALWSYWSLVTRQDYLVFHPLGFVFYSAGLLSLWERRGAIALFQFRRPLFLLPATVAAVEFVVCFFARPFWANPAAVETNLLRATYRLTDPGDFVLDEKGETVFRQRAFAPVWEPFVLERIKRGLMEDRAAERCIATHTCVATLGKDMSLDARHFIESNFLPIGSGLYVAGSRLAAVPDQPLHYEFNIVIPASYEIVASNGAVRGMLDNCPYHGACRLTPGRHVFLDNAGSSKLAVLWSQAVERKFTPVF